MTNFLMTLPVLLAYPALFQSQVATASINPNLSGLQHRVLDQFNVYDDFLDDKVDSTWKTVGGGLSRFTLVAEFGDGNAVFGIYNLANPSRRAPLFFGSDSVGAFATLMVWPLVGQQPDGLADIVKVDTSAPLGITAHTAVIGTNFGFYLKIPRHPRDLLFHSDTSENADDFDHMLAYQGTNNRHFLLAWEDLPGGGDRDYDDFVVSARGIEPVPEPASAVVWGALIALTLSAVRWRNTLMRLLVGRTESHE